MVRMQRYFLLKEIWYHCMQRYFVLYEIKTCQKSLRYSKWFCVRLINCIIKITDRMSLVSLPSSIKEIMCNKLSWVFIEVAHGRGTHGVENQKFYLEYKWRQLFVFLHYLLYFPTSFPIGSQNNIHKVEYSCFLHYWFIEHLRLI